ncbi:MAG: hypothetical protein QOD73_3373, partial [Solirubrobacteraceae bacterium]|nr:hypothetical protein [Solirubrobacteraceae bacterium]
MELEARDVAPPDDRDAARDDPDDRDEPDDRDAADRDDDRLEPDAARRARRSAAGISSVTTALLSCGISFVRNAAMRSSCLRWSRASFAVSGSPTASAKVSIAT